MEKSAGQESVPVCVFLAVVIGFAWCLPGALVLKRVHMALQIQCIHVFFFWGGGVATAIGCNSSLAIILAIQFIFCDDMTSLRCSRMRNLWVPLNLAALKIRW